MDLIDRYIEKLEGHQKEWVFTLAQLMRKDYPEIKESFEFEMPTYTGPDFYISFEAKKKHFYFYTDDTMVSSLIKTVLPKARIDSDYIKIDYDDSKIEELISICRSIVEYHRPDIAKDKEAQ